MNTAAPAADRVIGNDAVAYYHRGVMPWDGLGLNTAPAAGRVIHNAAVLYGQRAAGVGVFVVDAAAVAGQVIGDKAVLHGQHVPIIDAAAA